TPHVYLVSLIMLRLPPRYTLFPYTTLFRSFLSKKYQLYDNRLSLVQWKFMRLRTANFPTFRIAQFAMLIFRHGSLFSMLLSIERSEEHTSELQSRENLVCRLLLEKKNK